MKRFLIILLLLMFITACSPDPRKEAEAYATRIQADQDALNQQQTREHTEEVYDLQMQQAQLEQGHRAAIAQEWRNGLNTMLHIGFWFATAALCFTIFMTARSVNTAVSIASEGLATAMVRRAEVRANLIPLNPKTRLFDGYLQYLGQGRYAALNLNTNSVLLLDTRSEPDRQMIQTMGAVQYAGALAQEARQSTDPASVSIIQPPIVDVKSELITLGKDIWRDNE